MHEQLLTDVRLFLQESILPSAPQSFAIIYGGSVYKKNSRSDLDIAFVLSENLTTLQPLIERFVKRLHRNYHLEVDEEVPYSNKLVYFPNDIIEAMKLECFIDNNTIHVPRVRKNRQFLESPEVKARLLLNALTTPHQIIGQSPYSDQLERLAARQMSLLALALTQSRGLSPTITNCLTVLEKGEDAERGELYLGYKTEYPAVRAALKTLLKSALHSLRDQGVLPMRSRSFHEKTDLTNLIREADITQNSSSQILSNDTRQVATELLNRVVEIGVDFKLQAKTSSKQIDAASQDRIKKEALPIQSTTPEVVLKDFCEQVLPYCYNFSSPNFMGFPDAGNSIAGLMGAVLSDFLQQNLINQSFCSPSGTFVEMAVINWLRQIVGYDQVEADDVFGAGGIVTGGGTTSNTIAMLIAREQFRPNTMTNGVAGKKGVVIVPRGIGHYSVKSAQMWIGNGAAIVEVDTDGFRYDLSALRKALLEYKGRVSSVVAYVGDSRTMTIDNLNGIADLRDEVDPNIWLHADACHGFSLGFSSKLKHKIEGIERFDSITTDPHKVMNIPYTMSALLLKNPQKIKTAASLSDLIMQEQYAWGQVTPFIGSKSWISLKTWFAIKSLGVAGFGEIVERRHDMALRLQSRIHNSQDFVMINDVEINAVAFMYVGVPHLCDVADLNRMNRAIHQRIIDDGLFHLHQFSIPDAGIFKKGEILYPLRYMSGNPLVTEDSLDSLLSYIRQVAKEITGD